MLKRARYGKPLKAPEFVGKEFDCGVCGGRYKVTRRTQIILANKESIDGQTLLSAVCPYCGCANAFNVDVHKNFKAKLHSYVLSQVAPIKAIDDEKIRLPMQRLLDGFNRVLEESDE